jgi:hypothetical protein
MTITTSTTIVDFQNQFMRLFPFLKIEFFREPHDRSEKSVSEDMIFNRITPLSEIDNFKKTGVFEFNPEMLITDVEQQMQAQFGLSTQIFYKSNGEWVDITTKSPILTLAAQNAKGTA